MKQSNISPKIIELSKKISKYFRMEIYEGCWVWDEYGDPQIKLLTQDEMAYLRTWSNEKYWFPIPSISDVLKKLDDLGFMWNFQRTDKGDYQFHIYPLPTWVVPRYRKNYFETKDKHETVLLALLEVLRKKEAGSE